VIAKVIVIKFRMDNGGGSGAGCFEVEIWADTAKFTNVIVAGFRKCRDFIGEGKVFIKDKAKVASRVGCSERKVMYLRKLLHFILLLLLLFYPIIIYPILSCLPTWKMTCYTWLAYLIVSCRTPHDSIVFVHFG